MKKVWIVRTNLFRNDDSMTHYNNYFTSKKKALAEMQTMMEIYPDHVVRENGNMRVQFNPNENQIARNIASVTKSIHSEFLF